MPVSNAWKKCDGANSSSELTSLPIELKYMIIHRLPRSGTSALAKCCRAWYSIANAALYKNDAKNHNSSAIFWAAGKCKNEDIAMGIIELAVRFGGNVNAILHQGNAHTTSLHLATARGCSKVVKCLIQKGGNVASASKDMKCFTKAVLQCLKKLAECKTDLKRRSAANAQCLPLFVPMMRGDWETVKSLLDAGAPAQVMVNPKIDSQTSQFDETIGLTVLHLAAIYREVPEPIVQLCLRNFKSHINDQHLTTGDTALTLALLAKNETMTSMLLRAGADVNVRSFSGRNALFLTIDEVFLGEETADRKWYINLIAQLLRKGAQASAFNSMDELSTPLIATMRQALSDDSRVMAQRRQIIAQLVEHGAAVNARAVGSAQTAVQTLVLEVTKLKTFPGSFMSLLRDMVETYGADLNLPLSDESSILRTVLECELPFRPKLVKLLVELGAKVFASEAGWVFRKWMFDKKWRIDECIVLERKLAVPQEDIDAAYLLTFDGKENKEYMWLREHFPVWKNGNQILAQWILHQGAKLGMMQLELGFDPKWVDDEGRSILHLIVIRLLETNSGEGKSKYTEKQAVEDTKKLISMGMSVCVKDRGRRTGLHRLRMGGEGNGNLELLLLRQRDIERGEYFEDACDAAAK